MSRAALVGSLIPERLYARIDCSSHRETRVYTQQRTPDQARSVALGSMRRGAGTWRERGRELHRQSAEAGNQERNREKKGYC